ncbi:MAG: helix-turn-helix transcriptional regulator [Turicibacter sp.]|nr:helix-turn-helix transcriptional regulator [Turicibacter sp.]
MSKSKMIDTEVLTDSAFYILMSLLEPRHGYLIMQHAEAISDGEFVIGPATLYSMIKKLLKEGWIELLHEVDRKKVYQITAIGLRKWQLDVERRKKMVEHAIRAIGGNQDEKEK